MGATTGRARPRRRRCASRRRSRRPTCCCSRAAVTAPRWSIRRSSWPPSIVSSAEPKGRGRGMKSTKALLAGLAVALVAASFPASAQEKMKLKLVLPTAVTTFMLPYLVPKEQGWYEKQGLEVEELFVSGDSTALRTMLSGSGDLTIVGPPTVFKAVIEGAKVKSIGSWQPVVDYHIVAAKPISTIKELGGKIFSS